ncbi:hypothetical protein ACINNAV82_2771 [Acinetobacter baumannii Naval-82]|nr:hypothetical protein ACINNAV82_2771 [Acinetobacter baumannii Naval-82]
MFKIFLNGVCRHELGTKASTQGVYFLNGVCRHELLKHKALLFAQISKWRMPP